MTLPDDTTEADRFIAQLGSQPSSYVSTPSLGFGPRDLAKPGDQDASPARKI
jgi:hypothetical protein